MDISILNAFLDIWLPYFQYFHTFCPDEKQKLINLQVDKAFSTFDTNSDGKLNYKEFCIMVTTKEQERSVLDTVGLIIKHYFLD